MVSTAGDKLTTTAHDGTGHHHTVAKGAKMTHDGKACKTADLKAGAGVRVAGHTDNNLVIARTTSGKAALVA